MWIKKPEEQRLLELEYRKYKLNNPIFAFCFSALWIFILLFSAGSRGIHFKPSITDSSNVLKNILIVACSAMIISILVFWLQLRNKFSFASKTTYLFCLKCNRTMPDKKESKCECGGELVKFDEMEYLTGYQLKLYNENKPRYVEMKKIMLKKPVLYKLIEKYLTKYT